MFGFECTFQIVIDVMTFHTAKNSALKFHQLPSSRWDFIRLFTVCVPQVETWGYLLLSLRDIYRMSASVALSEVCH